MSTIAALFAKVSRIQREIDAARVRIAKNNAENRLDEGMIAKLERDLTVISKEIKEARRG